MMNMLDHYKRTQLYRFLVLVVLVGLAVALVFLASDAHAGQSELMITYESTYDRKGCRMIDMSGPYHRDDNGNLYFKVYKLCRADPTKYDAIVKEFKDEMVLYYEVPVVTVHEILTEEE